MGLQRVRMSSSDPQRTLTPSRSPSSGDLGYPIEPSLIVEKLAAIRDSPVNRVWVVELRANAVLGERETLAGLLSFHAIPLLHKVGGLVASRRWWSIPSCAGRESGDGLSVSLSTSHETSTASGWRSRAASSGTMRTASTPGLGSLHGRSVREVSGLIRVVRSRRSVEARHSTSRHDIQHRVRSAPFSAPPIFQDLERWRRPRKVSETWCPRRWRTTDERGRPRVGAAS